MSEAIVNDEVFLEEEEPSWRIDSDQSAEWAIRKIMEARKDTQKWKQHYEHQIETVKKQNERTEAFFTMKLQEYFAAVPHKVTKTTQKYALPSGELIFRVQEPAYKVEDQEAAVKWLHDNQMQDYIKTKEEVKWKELKELVAPVGDGVAVKDSGEMVPGITSAWRDPVFEIKIK